MIPHCESVQRGESRVDGLDGGRDGRLHDDAATGPIVQVALLTGGSDKPYALGLASALSAQGILVDFIGSDELDCPEVHQLRGVTFLNLRGDQRENVPASRKVVRIITYYTRLARYAVVARPRTLHILWNNKFELFDRTAVMLFYRLLGKRVVLTAHNVNAAKRDSRDSWINRLSLRIQYRLCHHIFVHGERLKHELVTAFGVRPERVSVIPFGINNTIPTTGLTRREARRRLGVEDEEKVALFFGQIAPYKGLEYLIAALTILARTEAGIRVVIAGKVKRGFTDYWAGIQQSIADAGMGDRVVQRIQFIPDEDVEQYFKAADVAVLPYTDIFQSGIPFLAYSFGLPVVATDVGSLPDDIVEGVTGFLCRSRDTAALANTIHRYFASPLYMERDTRWQAIRRLADERHSWGPAGEITRGVYKTLLGGPQFQA